MGRPRWLRRVILRGSGLALLVAGLILLPLPTPLGIVFIPAGLIVLSRELWWARWALRQVERRTGPVGRRIRRAEAHAHRKVDQWFGECDR